MYLSHTNANYTIFATGHGTLQQNEVHIFVNTNNFKILGGDGIATHVARKANAFEHTRGACALTDRTGSTMEVSTMSTRSATKVVATHNTSEALALGSAGHVDLFHLCEVRNGDLLAELVLGSRINANLKIGRASCRERV